MKCLTYISSILFCSMLALLAHGETIRVGPQERVKKISQAVEQAAPGDTILVSAGTYAEGNIVIKKPLVIIGRHWPTITGQNKSEILTIQAKHVVVEGFRFVDTGIASIEDLAAIKILDSQFLTIRKNKFFNTFFGIHISNSSDIRIESNMLQSKPAGEQQIGNGIHLWKCDHVTISDNDVSGHRDGIYFEFVTNSLITGNYSHHNVRYGLHFMFSHNDEYRANTFSENGAGVAVMYTTGVKMINNSFDKNWGSAAYGLLLKDIRDSEVLGNTFINNSVGIHMEGSSRIDFKENTFQCNGYAVRLQASCDANTFTRNNFIANTFDLATNGSLVLNTVQSNYWDRYEGYDLDKNGVGDVPYRPVSMYSMVVEQVPTAVLLWRSFFVFLMDRAEKAMPAITPENLKDDSPKMKAYDLNR